MRARRCEWGNYGISGYRTGNYFKANIVMTENSMNAALRHAYDDMRWGTHGMNYASRSRNRIPDTITGSETANTVLRELRLGLISPAFVRNWIQELRAEGFDRLCDALEANL